MIYPSQFRDDGHFEWIGLNMSHMAGVEGRGSLVCLPWVGLRNGFGGWDAPSPPEFAQPGLSRSNGRRPEREGENFGVFVPVWLVLPWCEATNLGVLD